MSINPTALDKRFELINHRYLSYGVVTTGLAMDAGADAVIIVTAAVTITLPIAADVPNRAYFIKNASGGVVTITPAGGIIDGTPGSITLDVALDCVELVSDGANWWIIASHRAPPPGP